MVWPREQVFEVALIERLATVNGSVQQFDSWLRKLLWSVRLRYEENRTLRTIQPRRWLVMWLGQAAIVRGGILVSRPRGL